MRFTAYYPNSPLKKSNSAYARPLRPMSALRSLPSIHRLAALGTGASFASLALSRNCSGSATKQLLQRTAKVNFGL